MMNIQDRFYRRIINKTWIVLHVLFIIEIIVKSQCARYPPSTTRDVPVTNLAASLSRYAAA